MMFLEFEDGLVELTGVALHVPRVHSAVPPAWEVVLLHSMNRPCAVAGPLPEPTCRAILRRIRTAMERVNPPMVIRRAEYMPDDEAAP